MRPEVGFGDLVRAIDRLAIRRPEDARAIAELIGQGGPLADDVPRPAAPSVVQAPPTRRLPRESMPPRADDERDPPRRPLPSIDAVDRREVAIRELPKRTRASAASALPFAPDGQPAAEPWPLETMIEPRLARAIIAALIGRELFDGPIDVAAAVQVIARGRPLLRVPRRRRRTLRFAAQILVDLGDGMTPFAGDVADLERRARSVVGVDRVHVVRFRGPASPYGPGDEPVLAQVDGAWGLYRFPSPGTPVLALTDLGLAHGGLRAADEASWLDLARMLARSDSELVILTPCPQDRWPRALRSAATIVQWDRATARLPRHLVVTAKAPRTLRRSLESRRAALWTAAIEQDFGWFAATHPASYALARLIALTARCEPALIRRLRRRFLPAAEAWIEGELWASPLLEVRSVSGVRLRADVTQLLVESWRNDPQLADVAALIEHAHKGAPQVVRMQEQLTTNVVRDGAQARRVVEQLLAGVAATLAVPDYQGALFAWALHVLRRLPGSILQHYPAAFHLALATEGAGAPLIGTAIHDPALLRPAVLNERSEPLASAFDIRSRIGSATPRRLVRVRRDRDAAILELTDDRRGGVAISVPDTRPVVLEIYAAAGDPMLVTIDAAPLRVPWPEGPLDIYALDGAGWQLLPAGLPRAPLAAPWSSLVWFQVASDVSFGYLVRPRDLVVPAHAVDDERIDPIPVTIGDVIVHARLARVDRALGLAILSLAEDAAVAPLPAALAGATVGDGVLAIAFDTRAMHVVTAMFDEAAGPTWEARAMVRVASADVTSGMPWIAGGAVIGMLGRRDATSTERTQRYPLVDAETIDAVCTANDRDTGVLLDLARFLAVDRPALRWSELEVAAFAVPSVRLADASIDAIARGGPHRRSAALLWWASAVSRHAVPHVLDALDEATRPIDREIAIYTLEAIVRERELEPAQARRARRRLDAIAGTSEALRPRIATLRKQLAAIEGPREASQLADFVLPAFLDPRSMDRVTSELKDDIRVVVLTGGIDGASRLGVAHLLHRAVPADLAIAWSFRDPADLAGFIAAAAEALGLPASAQLLDIARAAAEVDASVLLDRFDRIATRELAASTLQAFVDKFVELGRGRCIVTWGGPIPAFKAREAIRRMAVTELPPVVHFREHLVTVLESPRLLGKWLGELARWGPVAAVAAVVRVVLDTLPRTGSDGFLKLTTLYGDVLRAWLDRPGPGRSDQLARLSLETLRGGFDATAAVSFERLTTVLLLLMSQAELFARSQPTGPQRDAITKAIARDLTQVAPLLARVSLPTIQAIIRRAYLGTSYVRDDATEFVIAFDGPIQSKARDIVRVLGRLTAGDVDLAPRQIEPDKLSFRATPSVFRQLRERWRRGAMVMLSGMRIRWLAETNPFPVPSDPQKGHWGGLPERKGRLVTATVSRNETPRVYGDWYNIKVEIEARPGAPPLKGPIRIHLHDSFPEEVVELPFRRGRSVFTAVAWGSFTLGVECDAGTTHLELDLADVPNVSLDFVDEDDQHEPALAVASYGVELPLREGASWVYVTDQTSDHAMTVVEHVAHPNGVVAVRIAGLIAAPRDSVPALWLLTRGDGRYYVIPDDPESKMVRLRAKSDDLRDVMVAENLFLRFPARPGSSFANAYCIVHVTDVRFTTIRVRGYNKETVVYDLVQQWPGGDVKLSIAPGVGVVAAVDLEGRTWMLRGYTERAGIRKKPPSHNPGDGERPPPRKRARVTKPRAKRPNKSSKTGKLRPRRK